MENPHCAQTKPTSFKIPSIPNTTSTLPSHRHHMFLHAPFWPLKFPKWAPSTRLSKSHTSPKSMQAVINLDSKLRKIPPSVAATIKPPPCESVKSMLVKASVRSFLRPLPANIHHSEGEGKNTTYYFLSVHVQHVFRQLPLLYSGMLTAVYF